MGRGCVPSGIIALRNVQKSTIFSRGTPKFLLFSNKYNLVQNDHKNTSLIKFNHYKH